MFLVPFDATNVFSGLHESLYADHTSLSSFMAVTTAALWSHLWHYPDNLYALRDAWRDAWRCLDASYLQLLLPFLVPLTVWFCLDRFMKQSENAFRAMNRFTHFERVRLTSSHDDAELKQCLDMMKKNRQDYEELLELLDQFPGQRERADLDRLTKARKRTSGSGDVTRFQCASDSSDTDCEMRKIVQKDSDSEGTSPEGDLNDPLWKYEGVKSKACACDRSRTGLKADLVSG